MDRIIGAGTTDIGAGRRGFRDEDLPTGIQGTVVTAAFLNSLQEEIMQVLLEAGIVPDPNDWTQLAAAIKRIGGNADRLRWLAVLSMTTTAPPAGAALGDSYLVPAAATGVWAANIGKIAEWNGVGWTYYTPPNGHGIALSDGRVFVRVGGVYVEKLALDVQSGKWSYAVAAGTANALTAALTPVPASLASITGAVIIIKTGAAANTAAMTLNLNGLGAKSIVHSDGSAIAAGEIPASAMLTLIYDGTNFVAFSSVLAPGAATDAAKGIVELATIAETQTGTDAERAVTPAGLSARTATEDRIGLIELATLAEVLAGAAGTPAVTPATLSARTATDTRTGLVELATLAEARAGTDTTRAVTPAGLKDAVGPGTWADFTASRVTNTSYQNTTGRTIEVAIRTDGGNTGDKTFEVSTDGSNWIIIGWSTFGSGSDNTRGMSSSGPFRIPHGHFYKPTGPVVEWKEAR